MPVTRLALALQLTLSAACLRPKPTPAIAAPTARSLPPACAMSATDGAWIAHALSIWKIVSHDKLHLPQKSLPTIVTFDARCRYVATPRRDGIPAWQGTPHGGEVALPNGKTVPVDVVSFAAPSGNYRDGFFVMSLPSIWRAHDIQSGIGLEGLMDCVLLHELMHTWQLYFANPTLDDLEHRYHLTDVNDDALQHTYEANPAYVADYTAERDLLYAAASAADTNEARHLAARALAQLRARRAHWFVGDSEFWAQLDEIFLTMEGIGQWVAYAWLVDERGPHLAPDAAQREIRRKRKWWSQEEGLALFLVIDRLLPGWQGKAFAPRPLTAEALLTLATQAR